MVDAACDKAALKIRVHMAKKIRYKAGWAQLVIDEVSKCFLGGGRASRWSGQPL